MVTSANKTLAERELAISNKLSWISMLQTACHVARAELTADTCSLDVKQRQSILQFYLFLMFVSM